MSRVRLDSKTIKAVERVLRSGNLRAGALTEEFEARFAAEVGAKHAIAVNSGTAALHIAYAAMLQPGDEVIVPDFTFIATASMVVAAGGQPVLADVNPRTFTLDPADAEQRITPRTRALAPVHLYGHPAAISELRDLARRHHLKIIWDAAQAHGARFEGNDVGSLADAVCYSFYPTKNMTTGEGGMIATPEPDLAAEFKLLRSHGEQARYNHVRIGFNYRTTDIAAAIGLGQLETLRACIERRRRNAATLAQGLADIDGIHLPEESEGCVHAYHLFTIRVEPRILGMTRDAFRQALAGRGIETAVHYPRPLHRQPVLSGMGEDSDFPASTLLSETVVSLPVHPFLTSDQIRRVIAAVRRVTKNSAR
ncbi:MAG: DegT/DnrJ/EryC1/StrS family aminotransferase [Terriglobia bacterium]